MTICEAIARQEGFLVEGSRSNRNNNPGDIEYGPFAKVHGADRIEIPAPHGTARFAHFPDAETGFAAMRALLGKHYKGMTVREMLNVYAPPVENDDSAYIADVCAWTRLTPNTIIDGHL